MTTWEAICAPESAYEAWELFHENSKTGRFSEVLPAEAVLARMQQLVESLPFDRYPVVGLPSDPLPLELPLAEVLAGRASARSLQGCSLGLATVATLLRYGYGITRDNEGTVYPRPFRTVPSGGALYPLEIFFHSTRIEGLDPGLYHYNPTENVVRLLRFGDYSREICDAVVQSELFSNASLVVFVTALFERSIFKYGERGYRFVLLEAGHVGQNLNLVAHALGLAAVNVGGYFDREVDDLLGLDGLAHSTIYLTAIGGGGKDVPTGVGAP